MRKSLGGFLAVSLTAVLLAGCGSNNGGNAGGASNAGVASAGASPAASSGNAGGGAPTELVISTWGFSEDFFNESVYAPFEKKYNVKIVTDVGNNAERLNKIRQGSSNVDLIYLSDYYAQQGIDEGLFEKIDRSKIPNLDNIYDLAKAPLGEDYGPAYTIGRLGIAYNPDMVKKEVTSWSDLWDADFKNNVTLPNITATAGPMVLDAASKVAGESSFNEDAAFAKLKELNPNVVKYYTQTSEFVNMFSQGEIAGGPIMEMYFKDLKDAVPSAKFVAPSEGAYAVINTINIVKGSQHKELAEEFINWILSKEVQEASAKAKVDSPVNTQVQLSGDETQGITYGADVINSLVKLDMKQVNAGMKEWTDRWNRELAQ